MAVAGGEPVLLVESESSVDALAGHYATTWPGSASAVQIDRLNAVLGGYPHLVVITDFDQAGLICLGHLNVAGLVPHLILPKLGEDARDLYDRLGPTGFGQLVTDTVTDQVLVPFSQTTAGSRSGVTFTDAATFTAMSPWWRPCSP